MRGNDLLLAFPALLLAIMFAAVYGASTLVAMVAIGIATIPSFARLVRSGTLQVLGTEYAMAARAAGRSPFAIGAPARPAQREQPGDRAGLGRLRDRGARGGGAVVPRLRHPAAHPVVGPDAAGEPGAAVLAPRSSRCSRAWPSRSRCSGSTCSATGCATTSTPSCRTADDGRTPRRRARRPLDRDGRSRRRDGRGPRRHRPGRPARRRRGLPDPRRRAGRA